MKSTAAAAAGTTAAVLAYCLSGGTAAFAQGRERDPQQGRQPSAQRREQSSQQNRQPSSSDRGNSWRNNGDRGGTGNGRPDYSQQGQWQGQQQSGFPSSVFPQQAPSWVYGQQAPNWAYGQQAPSWAYGQGQQGQRPPQSSTPLFPPTSTGNTTSLQSLPPISGPGYYTLPDGSRVRPEGSSAWPQGGARGREHDNQSQPGSGIPLGNGSTYYPYPRNPNASIAPDAPYTRGPIRGTYQGRGSLNNILVFPGYRSTYIIRQTVLAPYGYAYGCPSYIDIRYTQSTPWPYQGGIAVAPIQPWIDDDSFVTADNARAQELRATLNDLTRFWENSDIRSLRRHLPGTDQDVAVFHNGKFLYSLARNDFAALSSDVADAVETTSFRFVKVERRDDGLIDATAKHVYRVQETGEEKTGTVRYSLLYRNGTYFVSAVALASEGEVEGLPAAK